LAIWQATAMERGKQSFYGCVFLSPRVSTSKDACMIGLQLLAIFFNFRSHSSLGADEASEAWWLTVINPPWWK
jgi:hypothetical protein